VARVVVFDASVLVAFLNRVDAHHAEAVERVRRALAAPDGRWLNAVTYAEILRGPLRAGRADVVDPLLGEAGIAVAQVDMALAQRTAAVANRTGLKLPDAFVLATVIHVEHRGSYAPGDVRLETFDDRLQREHAALHPHG
jgi:predicted nucleic acid-binding protein